MSRSAFRWAVALVLAVPAYAAEAPPRERATAGGDLAWFQGERLEISGTMRTYLPLAIGPGRGVYLDLDARTSIERVAGDFKFLVEDLDYTVEVGFKQRAARFTRLPLRAFAGQQGTQRVDADGEPFVRYVGGGVASAGYRRRDTGLRWRADAGVVLEQRQVRADGLLRGKLDFTSRAGRGFGSGLGFAVEVDGLLDGSDFRGDWRGGPHRRFALGGGVALRLFAHWIESRHPLGLGDSGLTIGLDLRETDNGSRPPGAVPDVGGSLATGGGEGRLAARLLVRVLSPQLTARTRLAAEVDANILTAADTGELYYLYHFGVEQTRGPLIGGVYFYHRSNHQLAEPNDAVTAINVLETGVETRGWDRPGRDAARTLEARFRAGYLIDSNFGERRRWHARGGLRWRVPLARDRVAPFVLLEAETGDVDRRLYALGLAPAAAVELRVEYREDDQFFGRDRDALLLTTHVGF